MTDGGIHKIERRKWSWREFLVRMLMVIGMVAVAYAVIAVPILRAQVRALSTAVDNQREQVKDSGQTPLVPPASEIRENPERAIPGPAGPAGPGPSDADVRAAVEDYFRRNPVAPGRPPTPAEIAAAVINYLRANPPAAGPIGPGPTGPQIATAVASYLTTNPPPAGPKGDTGTAGTKGDTGAQGEPGRGPTAAEISAAVAEYIRDNPPPSCAAGYRLTVRTLITSTGPVEAMVCTREEPS